MRACPRGDTLREGADGSQNEFTVYRQGAGGIEPRVLSRQRKNVSSRAEGAKKQYEASMEELGGLAEKILQSSAWIERNPVQARQDLAIIARRLKEAVDRVRDVMG